MVGPLSQFPAYPKKWLPKFNPDNSLILYKEQQDHGTFHYHQALLIAEMLFKRNF